MNPWNPNCTPGGSSGGEACLIADRGSFLGIGTDIGGSIRIPSHFCGIYGLKPTAKRLVFRGGSIVLIYVFKFKEICSNSNYYF